VAAALRLGGQQADLRTAAARRSGAGHHSKRGHADQAQAETRRQQPGGGHELLNLVNPSGIVKPGYHAGEGGQLCGTLHLVNDKEVLMHARFNYAKTAPGIYDAMDHLEAYLQDCGLEKSLLFLIQPRASQINGCAYCLDMHWKASRTVPGGYKSQQKPG
jgi:Carboxymuconolactone decarboxylase family